MIFQTEVLTFLCDFETNKITQEIQNCNRTEPKSIMTYFSSGVGGCVKTKFYVSCFEFTTNLDDNENDVIQKQQKRTKTNELTKAKQEKNRSSIK